MWSLNHAVGIAINLENLLVALFAAMALLFTWTQIRSFRNERLARETDQKRQNAEALWRQYELLCIRHPEFAYPRDANIIFDEENETGTFDGDRRKFTSYEYFVSFMLYAMEEVHDVFGNIYDWETSIRQEIYWHETYLSDNYFQAYLTTNNNYIRQLITEMRTRKGINVE